MKYAVDRIEGKIVIIENLETRKIKEIEKEKLPKGVKEGSLLVLDNNEYKFDLTEEELRRQRIQERFNKLRKKDIE